MTENIINLKKPIAIIIICFIAFINASQLLFMVFSPVSKQLSSFYPLYFGCSALFSFVSIAGLWLLKKWAVYLYTIILVSNQLVLYSMKLWELTAMLIPMLILILLFNHRNKMS